MILHCPKCITQILNAVAGTLGDAGAAAHRCPGCSGFWVRASVLSDSASRASIGRLDSGPPRSVVDDPRTGQCPENHGLLRRARVTFHDPYFLERCSRCGGVWFDAGDWSRAAAENLFADLSQLWSPAWRRHLSEEQSRDALEFDLRRKLGEELFELLTTFCERLETHPHCAVALAYVSERLKHPDGFETLRHDE